MPTAKEIELARLADSLLREDTARRVQAGPVKIIEPVGRNHIPAASYLTMDRQKTTKLVRDNNRCEDCKKPRAYGSASVCRQCYRDRAWQRALKRQEFLMQRAGDYEIIFRQPAGYQYDGDDRNRIAVANPSKKLSEY